MRCGNIFTISTAACCQLTNDTSRCKALSGLDSLWTLKAVQAVLRCAVPSCARISSSTSRRLSLPKIDLVADEEGRGTERAARHRVIGVLDQLLLDVVLLGTGDDAIDVEPRRQERFAKDLRVVHLLRLDPHVMIGGAEIGFEQPLELGRDGAAHQQPAC